ncbi:MAG: ankyrin repeat domain-containing protein, partial [Candidatus Heimdallarchaeota archaeon]|nr:ankyrin repeat domain-containing protein [Candidatus Heimdallarchaeota archaeon]
MKYLVIPFIIFFISCAPKPTEQDKAFFLAYYDNDYETVRKLARQVNVNVKWFDQTPLQVAIDIGNTAMVKLFIDKGADVIVQDLYDACRNETVPIVRLLIENGADINAETRKELEYKEDDEDPRSNIVREEIVTTPLSAAAEYGNWEVVHFLVENGANYKKRDIDSYLNGAAYSGNLDFFILLIDKGAHINSKSDQGVTLLHSACKGGNADIISYLIEQGFNVNSKDADGRTTLYSAASMEHLNLVRMLINLGVDFKSTDNYGNTLLHAAAGKNTVQFFIDKGISVNVKNEAGKTPLHLACASNELEKTKTLIKNNADINAMDHEGNTPLLGMFTYFDYYISEYYNTRSRNFRKNNVFRESALIRRYLRACRHLQDETYLGAHYLDEG